MWSSCNVCSILPPRYTGALSDFRAEFLVFTILILIIWGCSPKSPLFEYKIDIILRNRHWHRFRTFIVVYFIFCFRKKIFFQSQQYNIGFSWKHFLRFFDFFQNEPQIFLPEEILSLKSSILPIAMKVRSKDAADTPASFALLFVQNYAILDLSDKISSGRWWIPKCSFFTALKSDNAPGNTWCICTCTHTCVYMWTFM